MVVRADTAFEIISGVVLLSVQGVHLPQLLQRAAVGVKVEISADHGGRGLEILPHPIEIEIVGVDAVFVRAAIVDQQVDAALSQREGGVVRCRNVKDLRLFGQTVDIALIKLDDRGELVLHNVDIAYVKVRHLLIEGEERVEMCLQHDAAVRQRQLIVARAHPVVRLLDQRHQRARRAAVQFAVNVRFVKGVLFLALGVDDPVADLRSVAAATVEVGGKNSGHIHICLADLERAAAARAAQQ